MTATYIFGGAIVDTVVYDDVELVDSAETGAIGTGRLTVRDDDGTWNIIGWKTFIATENDCANERTLTGLVGQRGFSRGDLEAANARMIDVEIQDRNALLGLRALRGPDAKRPRESVGARLTWLLGTPELGDLVDDHGRVTYPSKMMDKADHRKTYPGDVLAECAIAAGGLNYYVYTDESTGDASLCFRDDNASTADTSVLRISNVAADLATSSNTLYPSDDVRLTRDPSAVYSRVAVPYANGTAWVDNGATASNYRRRDGVAPTAHTKTRTKAIEIGNDYLTTHRTEEDVIDVSIPQVRSDQVNLVHAGDRIAAKFSHFTTEGYGDFTYFRVLERKIRPLLRDTAPALYEMDLKLSPQEQSTCAELIQVSAQFADDQATFDDPVTIGNTILAIGVRQGEATPSMLGTGISAGFTTAATAHADDCCGNNGVEGVAYAFYKVATSTSAGPYFMAADGAHYLWRLYEIAANGAAPTVISLADQGPVGGVSTTFDLGTLTGQGVAVMAMVEVRGNDQRPVTGVFGMGSWTKRTDDRIDPGDPGSLPWVGIGDISAFASHNPAWTFTEGTSDQTIGEWGGVAVLFGC